MNEMGARGWLAINVIVVLLMSCSVGSAPDGKSPALEMLFSVLDEVDSGLVRVAGNQFIDIQAAVLKLKWNLAMDLWDGLTPEQRRGLLVGVMQGLEGARERLEAAAVDLGPITDLIDRTSPVVGSQP